MLLSFIVSHSFCGDFFHWYIPFFWWIFVGTGFPPNINRINRMPPFHPCKRWDFFAGDTVEACGKSRVSTELEESCYFCIYASVKKIHLSKLTARPWKMMVGSCFLLGPGLFSGAMLLGSFREGRSMWMLAQIESGGEFDSGEADDLQVRLLGRGSP